jgi:hypothetical protein
MLGESEARVTDRPSHCPPSLTFVLYAADLVRSKESEGA